MTIPGNRRARAAVTPAANAEADPYKGKWSTLSNTTLGMLMATIDMSIVLISLPDIFRGIKLDPLTAGNTSYFLWLLMGYMLVTAVLVVTFGRLGDIFGRVRMYNLGFVIFTVFSILLSVTWMHGRSAALFMIIMRIFQGVGGALLFANTSAILTDAFPPNQRGMALGTNMVAAIGGSFIGLVLGGLLGPIDWRLVFWVSVPVGIVGTVWGFINLKDKGVRTPAKIDWLGNLTFATGLVAVLVGIVYGIEPYGTNTMGWTNPFVDSMLGAGIVILALFVWVETKVEAPMFRIPLFKIRAFTAGNIASLMSSVGRGGMMFTLIIWLQGIWLPQHGYSFSSTPLWAGIYMLPLTAGFLISGPISGILSDRYGSRPFAVGGMLAATASFILLETLPINFNYIWFALLLLLNGLAMGVFAAPNRANIMNSLPANERGTGSGMATTGQNASMVLSIGIFFTLIIVGLAGSLHTDLFNGLVANGVPKAAAQKVANLPPTATVFGAFLGYNPIQSLLGPTGVLSHLSHAHAAYLTGRSFFPKLIAKPFGNGLHEAFDFAAAACFVAAIGSAVIPSKKGRVAAAKPAVAATAGMAPPAGMAPVPQPEAVAAVGADRPEAVGEHGHEMTTTIDDIDAELAAMMKRGYDGSGHTGSEYGGNGGARTGYPGDGHTEPEYAAGGHQDTYADAGYPDPEYADGHPVEHTDYGQHYDDAGGRHQTPTGAVTGQATDYAGGEAGNGDGRGVDGFTGTVRARHGQPIAGASITVLDVAGAQVARTVTGEGGGFHLAGMAPGNYTALITAAGHRPAAVFYAGPGGRSEFTLTGAGALNGTVRRLPPADTGPGDTGGSGVPAATGDSGNGRRPGDPLAGATVTVTDESGHVAAHATTAADGRYQVADLPEGRYSVTANLDRYHPATAQVTVTAGAHTVGDLHLAGTAAVSGVIRQAATGTPLAGATVTLADTAGHVVTRTVTGADGRYHFADLPEGRYTIVASGFHPVATQLTVTGGQDLNLDLALGQREK